MNIDNPVTIASLDQVFQCSIRKAEKNYTWYKKRTWKYRILAGLIRIVALTLIVLGVILPLTTQKPISIGEFSVPSPAQAGYICLLLAVFIFMIDQVFMLSSSWVRYINTMAKIRTLIVRTEYEWLRIQSEKSNSDGVHEQREKALDLFQRLAVDSQQIVQDETAAWGTELNLALQKLDNLIKEHRTTVEALYNQEKKAREEAKKV